MDTKGKEDEKMRRVGGGGCVKNISEDMKV